MSKLNKSKPKSKVTRSYSANGNLQIDRKDKELLYDILSMTLLGKDQYYTTSDSLIEKMGEIMKRLVAKNQIDFILNLAVHTRTNMNIRSMPIVMLVHLGKFMHESKVTSANYKLAVRDVIQRADELTDMYAYAISYFGGKGKIPLAIKKGVALAARKFDEYQYGKYKGNRKELSMKQLFQIVHPVGETKEQLELFRKVNEETLKTPYTWETQLSEAGKSSKSGNSKTKVWEELIDSDSLGIMATIRNLRNMVEAGVNRSYIDKICKRLETPHVIHKSKMFPYQFLSANRVVKDLPNSNKILRAIDRATEISVNNVPEFDGNVWVIVDCSTSMTCGRNINSITPYDKASLFAAAIAKKNADKNFAMTLFSDDATHLSINPDSTVVDITESMKNKVYGGGTNLRAALNYYHKLGFKPDVMVLFSDMEVNKLNRYNGTFNTHPVMVDDSIIKLAVNAAVSTNTPASMNQGWMQVSGYSDSIFDYIKTKNDESSILYKLSKQYLGYSAIKSL